MFAAVSGAWGAPWEGLGGSLAKSGMDACTHSTWLALRKPGYLDVSLICPSGLTHRLRKDSTPSDWTDYLICQIRSAKSPSPRACRMDCGGIRTVECGCNLICTATIARTVGMDEAHFDTDFEAWRRLGFPPFTTTPLLWACHFDLDPQPLCSHRSKQHRGALSLGPGSW